MKKIEDISNWELKTPLLASLKKINGFIVPNSYFDTLSKNIINQVKIEELTGRDSLFEVPTNYFDSLGSEIKATIYLASKKDSLNSKNEGFTLPNHYFEISKAEIIAKIDLKKSSFKKIISLKFIRYAAAACVLLTTSVGIYLNVKQSNNINYQLSKVSGDAIENYLKQTVESSDVPVIIKNLENKPVFSLDENQLKADDIDSYLKTTL